MHIKRERTCVACKQKKQQTELLRISKVNNTFTLDVSNKSAGRGAYICKDANCIALTIKKHLLNRAFKMNVNQSIYDELGEYGKNN